MCGWVEAVDVVSALSYMATLGSIIPMHSGHRYTAGPAWDNSIVLALLKVITCLVALLLLCHRWGAKCIPTELVRNSRTVAVSWQVVSLLSRNLDQVLDLPDNCKLLSARRKKLNASRRRGLLTDIGSFGAALWSRIVAPSPKFSKSIRQRRCFEDSLIDV